MDKKCKNCESNGNCYQECCYAQMQMVCADYKKGVEIMTDRERVEAIRNALKEKGYSSRRVGVTYHISGCSAIIRVSIKESGINKAEIENIVSRFNDIDRDERTGEILEGGNTFVSVYYNCKLTA